MMAFCVSTGVRNAESGFRKHRVQLFFTLRIIREATYI